MNIIGEIRGMVTNFAGFLGGEQVFVSKVMDIFIMKEDARAKKPYPVDESEEDTMAAIAKPDKVKKITEFLSSMREMTRTALKNINKDNEP